MACCPCGLWDVAQVFEFETDEKESRYIHNVKVFDYFFYVVPGSAAWKRLRQIKRIFDFVTILTVTAWPFVFVVLDPSLPEAELVQGIAVTMLSACCLFLILVANVEVVRIRLKSLVAVFDSLSALTVIIILFVYGEGFVLYGTIYCIGLFINSYATEANEVDRRLNLRDNVRTILACRKLTHICLIAAAVAFRVGVFLKQVTVRNDIVVAVLLDGKEVLRLRDLWEFCVDIVVVRSVYLSLARFTQPLESIALGTSYATLRAADP